MENGSPVIGSKLRYAIAELTMKNGSNVIECGLFMGIQVKAPNGDVITLSERKKKAGLVCVWLYTEKDKKIRVYNMNLFSILSLETYNGISRTIIYFMATDSDQETAMKIAKDTVKGLSSFPTADPDIVNVKKFTDVPDNFTTSRQGVAVVQQTPYSHNTPGKAVVMNRQSTTPGYSGNTQNWTKRDPEPSTFRRKGRRPTKKSLQKLVLKLDLIAKGEYVDKLPRITGDTKKERGKTAAEEADADAAHFNGNEWY